MNSIFRCSIYLNLRNDGKQGIDIDSCRVYFCSPNDSLKFNWSKESWGIATLEKKAKRVLSDREIYRFEEPGRYRPPPVPTNSEEKKEDRRI